MREYTLAYECVLVIVCVFVLCVCFSACTLLCVCNCLFLGKVGGCELKREQQEDMSRWQLGRYVKLQATCMSSSRLNEVSGLSVQDTVNFPDLLFPGKRGYT